MTPYYDHDGITIYHGDCREVLPTLGPVDLILMDPPYGINYTTNWRASSDPLRAPIANDNSLDVVGEAWTAIMSCLRDDRHWYSFATLKPGVLRSMLFSAARQILVWDKGDEGTAGDLKSGFGECCEAVLYGTKGRRRLNGPRPRSIIRHDWSGSRDPLHPTVKPIPLLQKFVAWSTSVGETVLDPFMGSGTTLVAAKLEGRKAVGIELEERYCEIAAKRLAQGVLF